MGTRARLFEEIASVANALDVPFGMGQPSSSACRRDARHYTPEKIHKDPCGYGDKSLRHRSGKATSVAAGAGFDDMPLVGRSPSMLRLFSLIERIAPTDSSTLIMGATGTGKELVARALHQRSPRHRAPFVDINCSAIPDTLLESELFGHQRGAFTGAHETRRGLFEAADGGTIFLDEVHSLSMPSQSKLLRALQERCLRRVGGRENIPFNARIIAATNSDLQAAVADGTFRADLLFRLRVMPLHVPELHERGEEDTLLLVTHFLQKHAEQYGLEPRRFAPNAGDALKAYTWPGNVRELENAVEYALAIGVNDELNLGDLPPEVIKGAAENYGVMRENVTSQAPLAEIERRYILHMFDSFGENQVKAATALGINRRTLYRKLKEYGLLKH